jgi:hypothetical protein
MAITANNSNTLNYYQSGNLSYSETTSYCWPDPFRTLTSPYKALSFPLGTGIMLQARQVQFTPNTLGSTTHIYTSPLYADMVGLAAYFADWGCSYNIQEGPIHTITVTCPWDTITTQDWYISIYASEQWEIVPNQITKELKNAGLLYDCFLPSSPTNLVILPNLLKLAVDYGRKNDVGITLSGSDMNPTLISDITPYLPAAKQTLDYYKMGIDGVPNYSQTVKRTAVIDKNNKNMAFQKQIDATQASLSKTTGTNNFILSTPDLIKYYDIPADTVGKFLMPSYKKKMTITNVDEATYYSFAGWLVKPPSFQFIGRNKVQLTQEFVWDEWLEGLYYIYSSVNDFVGVN